MRELGLEDQSAADRLSAFLLGEVYRSVAQVLAEADPAAADTLFRRVEATVATTLRRINAERTEGPNSAAIVLSVCEDVGQVLKSAHGRPERIAARAAATSAEQPRALQPMASRPPARAA